MRNFIKKYVPLILVLVIITTMFTGCNKTIIPFAENPENSIKTDIVEDSIKNAELNKEIYKLINAGKTLGKMPDKLDEMFEKLKEGKTQKEYENALAHYMESGEYVWLVYIVYKKEAEEMNKEIAIDIASYIKASRYGENDKIFKLAKDFEKQNPIAKVKQYMAEKKIKITDLDLPNTVESYDIENYPFRFTYRYVIRGTVNEKPFEKEVVQDFYFVFEPEGDDKVTKIVGIKDVKNN